MLRICLKEIPLLEESNRGTKNLTRFHKVLRYKVYKNSTIRNSPLDNANTDDHVFARKNMKTHVYALDSD